MGPPKLGAYTTVVKRDGFTILELLIAVAIASILATLGATLLRPANFEVDQAARASADAIVRARLEAIRVNGYSTIVYDTTLGSLIICTSSTRITACGAGSEAVRANLPLGDDFPRVTVTPSGDFSISFDRRGFSRGTSGSLRFTGWGTGTVRTLTVSPVGRVTVETI